MISLDRWVLPSGFYLLGNYRHTSFWGRYTGSDDPTSWRYLGVNPEKDHYNALWNTCYSSTMDEGICGFIGEHYWFNSEISISKTGIANRGGGI